MGSECSGDSTGKNESLLIDKPNQIMQTEAIKDFNYFVKGDISGIQEFIFSVKSEGAAKSLKARSYFILALSKLCLRALEMKVNSANLHVIFDGGGNFYAFVKIENEEVLSNLQNDLSEELAQDQIYLSLSWYKFKADKDLQNFG
ncbi:MAG: hypothetical protein ABIO24_12115, partial [Saprospiraceae bacterium]